LPDWQFCLVDPAVLTSHTWVESAGCQAHQEGFLVTFLNDAVADFTDEARRAAFDMSFGHDVTAVDECRAAIETAGA
jgi:nicotinamidase-related amidase